MDNEKKEELNTLIDELCPNNLELLVTFARGMRAGIKEIVRRQYGLTPEGCPAERRAEGAV
jgi:hypothetical protein